MNELITNAAQWFGVHVPDLKAPVDAAIRNLEAGIALTENEKKLFGFLIFDYAMHSGPGSFPKAEQAAAELGVIEEMAAFAQSWLDDSLKNKP